MKNRFIVYKRGVAAGRRLGKGLLRQAYSGLRDSMKALLSGQCTNAWRVYLAAAVLLLALLVGAWLASDTLAYRHFDQYMRAVRQNNGDRLQELRTQVDDTFTHLSVLSSGAARCSPEIFEQQVAVIREWRYISESAIRLESGAVCNSYGVEQTSATLPAEEANYYLAQSDRHYWFQAGDEVSADAGNLVIRQGNAYLWINKGQFLDILSLPEGMLYEVVDERTLQSRLSNDAFEFQLLGLPRLGELQIEGDFLYFAYPLKWPGLFAQQVLPVSVYQQLWLRIFAGLLLASLLGVGALFYAGRYAYGRYFSLQAKLRMALSENRLKVRYQPIVDMRTGQWKGAEALLRWSLDGQAISPEVFIALAEKSGMIRDLTRWVCLRVAQDCAAYLWACKEQYITINLSAADLADGSFVEFVERMFNKYEIPPYRIVFEVTESSLLDKEVACVQLQRLRELGHKVAVDDFGTGYSCLAYLEELPVDILKIDRSFLTPDKMHSTDGLWWHVASMARALRLSVVAEGVERNEQVEPLVNAGVSLAQGWLYSKDLPIDQLARHFFVQKVDPAGLPGLCSGADYAVAHGQ